MIEKVMSGIVTRHIRTGGIYYVFHLGRMKIGDEWKDAVIYRSIDDPSKPMFVREMDKFKRFFEEV
jgi:hypothetical protein